MIISIVKLISNGDKKLGGLEIFSFEFNENMIDYSEIGLHTDKIPGKNKENTRTLKLTGCKGTPSFTSFS